MKVRSLFFLIIIIFGCYLGWLFFQTALESSSVVSVVVGEKLDGQISTEQRKPLNMGFIPQGNAFLMVKRWQPLADYLSIELNQPVDIILRSSYREIIDALAKGELDICLTGAFVYVLTKKEADITPVARRKKFGTPYYHSLIVVRKDRNIHSLQDLKGKTFAFIDKNSTSGYLLPTMMMRKVGISDPNHFFSEVIFTQNHDSGVLAVQKKQIDGAAISSTRWLPNDSLVKDLKIIWKSKPILLGPFSVRSHLDEALIKKITGAFLKIGSSPETQHLAQLINVKAFERAFDKDYDYIREISNGFTKN